VSGPDRHGTAFVVAAPSGTGKTTVCRAVVESDPLIEHSISHTTREQRPGEEPGIHYHFVQPDVFLEMVQKSEFLEHASYNGKNYGTSREALRQQMEERGLDVLLEIEVQGARQIREKETGARFIFLLPPSMLELSRRLRGRGTDDEDTITNRLAIADIELAAVELFDYAVVNDDLDEAIASVAEIIAAERAGDAARLTQVEEVYGRAGVWARWRKANQADLPAH
jgi:guanylate kinase